MSAADLFAGFNQELLGEVTEAVGAGMALASSTALLKLAGDDKVDPATFAAGVARAHLLGAASALAGAEAAGALRIDDPESIAADVGQFIAEALADMPVKP